ncbi:MAG: hypothetical protein ACK55I_21305, partial [bacterium]
MAPGTRRGGVACPPAPAPWRLRCRRAGAGRRPRAPGGPPPHAARAGRPALRVARRPSGRSGRPHARPIGGRGRAGPRATGDRSARLGGRRGGPRPAAGRVGRPRAVGRVRGPAGARGARREQG